MSQKKHKKRNSNYNGSRKDPMKLQSAKNKKMDPLTRNILLSDLIILAASMMLQENGMISDTMAGIVCVVGVIMLIVALYLLFGPPRRIDGAPK